MTEFAYSGIGINPHYGTPKGAWQRGVGHVPGGSSSGAAVSVVDRMAHGALGTDTGGSCRIPAAYNGIVGFKPTQRRVPLDGGVPLSFTLDSFGPLARSVGCCAVLDAVLANEAIVPLQPRPIKGMRLAVPTTVAPRCRPHWHNKRPTPPAAACTSIHSPRRTGCTRRTSNCAVIPLTMTAAASRSHTASGRTTASLAEIRRSCA